MSTNCEPCGTCLPTVVIPAIDPKDSLSKVTMGVVTEEVVTGKGVFDVYMRAAKAQLDSEYTKGRIKGADYAAATVQLITEMMTQANQFVIAQYTAMLDAEMKMIMFPYQAASLKYDTALKEATVKEMMAKSELTCKQTTELVLNGTKDRELKSSQIAVQKAQKDLYVRQTTGFDDKKNNDNLKIVTDAWSVQATEMNENGTLSAMTVLYPDSAKGILNTRLLNIVTKQLNH